jgi:hypothetical protein
MFPMGLDEIGQIRSAFNTAQNTLGKASKQAAGQTQSNREALLTHLQAVDLSAKNVLAAVNLRRQRLGLSIIGELTTDTKVDEGLATNEPPKQFNKQSALRDIKAFDSVVTWALTKVSEDQLKLLDHIGMLEGDPNLLSLVQHSAFIESGFGYVEEASCPLCDVEWESIEKLREHLKAKLAKSKFALSLQQAALSHASAIIQMARQVSTQITIIQRLATDQGNKSLLYHSRAGETA